MTQRHNPASRGFGKTCAIALVFLGLIPACGFAQNIIISQEQFHIQTGTDDTSAVEGKLAVEVNGMPGIIGASLASSGPLNDQGAGSFERSFYYNSLGEMTAAHPFNTANTISLVGAGPDSGGSVVVPGPATGSFTDYAPVVPLFAISGVSGSWSTEGGFGVFRFVPAESFTVTLLNPYSSSGQGSHYGYYMSATDENDDGLGDIGAGPLKAGETFVSPTLTFSLNPQEGEIGFAMGSVINLEAAFYNILYIDDAGLGNGSEKAFIVGNGTLLTMIAVPEPSTYGAFAGLGVLGLALARRRRGPGCR